MSGFTRRLSYSVDVGRRFAAIAHRPWSVWLDSGYPAGAGGRFDYCADDPWLRIVSRDGTTEVRDRTRLLERSDADPPDVLRRWLPRTTAQTDLPFAGGAIGYFAYGLGRRLAGLSGGHATEWPELAIGVYDRVLVTDHLAQRAWAVSAGTDPDPPQSMDAWIERFRDSRMPSASPCRPTGHVTHDLSPPDYRAAFDRVMAYIHEGDCYQVNLSQRFRVPVSGDPFATYMALRAVSPVPYGAYLNIPDGQVLCASPELFLKLHAGQVETRPIKGTRPRGVDQTEDQRLHDELRESTKDRAENLMIVDLLRNDLGKSCIPGSIEVPTLFEVERLANVQHLVSTVTGTLSASMDALDLLAGCFPGGSITGAPKRRAMQIIDELEPVPRELYCGSIGWIGCNGDMALNIAIRTLLHRKGEMSYWAGGGLVADSEPVAEYRESLDKSVPFFRTLGITPELDVHHSRQRSKK